jgi:hypothetical protein
VCALVGTIVVAAVQADGRSNVRAATNDGGAWLIKRDQGLVGHVNRAVGEVSGIIRAATPGAEFDVEQDGELVVVNDRSTSSLSVIDGRTFQVSNSPEVPADAHLAVVGDQAIVWTQEPLAVWRLSVAQLTELGSISGLDPQITADGPGLVAVTPTGTVLALDVAGSRLVRLPADASASIGQPLAEGPVSATALSAIGDDAVLLTPAGIVVVGDEGTVTAPAAVPGGSSGAALAQPSPSGSPLVAAAADGTLVAVDPGSGQVESIGAIGAGQPLAPIVHDGCVFAVGTVAPTFTRVCNGDAQTTSLEGVSGGSLRLRLVNGWVWVNDLDTGALWVTSTEGELDRIDDWGADLADSDGDDNDSETEDGDTEQRQNPDADDAVFTRADELDEDGINEPPVARDDQVRTRVDQPVVVDVLGNDEDPDGDVLLVTALAGQPPDALVTQTADRTHVQVTPPAGFEGSLGFDYTITDGRGGTATAHVTVDVASPDGADNRPPVTVTDVAEARAGAAATLNVLLNDSDPDGDTLVLDSVTSTTGAVTYDPSGQLSFTPDPTSPDGTVELEYVVADGFGATTTGTVRVEIRLDGSNNEPDARNDSGVTVTGKAITFNVLANDTDPDNDPLSMAGQPTLLSPPDVDPANVQMSISPDGELFFAAAVAGSYLYSYSVIDGSESDTAIIRIDVDPATDNRPPVAVRDDLTIARGGTKTVYVLQNDADPDGDVIALTDWSGADGISIDEVQGTGFRITVAPDAPDRVQFRYAISDGRSDPVPGTVVVSVSNASSVDQAPVLRPDILELRPGRTAPVRVLLNDYDPEGGPLRVVGVAEAPEATLRVGPGGQEIFVSVAPGAVTGFSFGYDVVDEAGNRNASFVQVRLVPEGEANRPPIARPDVARTRVDAAITIAVLANDSDPDGDPVRLESIVAQPAFGTAVANADGTVTYTPIGDVTGSDRLRYVVVDAFGDGAIGEVLIGVIGVDGANHPPSAADDAYTVLAGSDPIALDVTTNDYDMDGDHLTVARTAGADGVVDVLDPRTHVTFDPPATVPAGAETSGVQVTFTYDVDDGRGGSDSAVVTVTVVAALQPVAPIAVDDQAGPVRPGDVVTVDVRANDLDPDGARAALVVTPTDPVGDPALTIDPVSGLATITAGADTSDHSYTITDPSGLSASALVTLIVTDNLAPTIAPLEVETPAGQPVTLTLSDQVSDADGDELFFACCENARGGSATPTQSTAGTLVSTFTPDATFAGRASFAYSVDDQHGHVVAGSVIVRVLAPENRPPVATDGALELEAGTVGTVALGGFATDPDLATGDTLSFELLDGGDATLAGSTVTLDLPIDAGGSTRALPFRVTDRAGASAEATVTVTVTEPSAPPPTAVADRGRTTQGVAIGVDVVANDIDPLGRGLTVIDVGTQDGTGSATTDGRTLTFQPGADFFGTATLSYTVQDARGDEAGQATGQLVVDVIGLPGTPPTPQAQADNATATVTWGQAAANGSPIDDVEIQSDQVGVRSIGPVNSYTYTGLTNGVAHRFQVRAHNEAGWGPWSELSAPVTPDTQPGRPASPAVTFGDGQLQVTWSAPPNEGSAITGYELEIGGGATGVQALGNTTSYTWTGLANGTNYQFRVVARNAAGISEPSPWSAAEHPLREPGSPGTPAAAQGDAYLDLSWSPAATNGDPVIEYQLEMQSQPGSTVPVTATSHRWSNLPNGVEQQFRVRARNRDADWGAWSGWSTPQKPCGVPDTPGTPTAARGDKQAQLGWAAPGDQGCSISQYQVETNTGLSQSSSATTHTFTGLANGTAYQFRVRAVNSVGNGAWSGWSPTVTPAGLPTGPATVTATNTGVGTVRLVFPGANANGAALLRYEGSANNGAARDIGLSTTYSWSGLANGTTYSFRVRACNDVGCGAWSAADSATTWGEPSQVGTPSVNAGNGTLSANWSAPAANGSAISSYDVELDPGSVASTTATSRSWNNVNNGTTYRVRARACNDVGCGAWSAWASGTPRSPVDVRISKGASAVGQPNCSHSSCAWVNTVATGLTPNTTYTVQCHDSRGGGGGFSPSSRTTDGNGRLTDTSCYYGYPGEDFWVTVGSYESNHITW